MTETDFQALIDRARTGDEEALAEVLSEFEPEVRTIVRSKLPRILRSEFDSVDFVQAVWKSLLEFSGELPDQFDSPARLKGYLAGMARNKVLEAYRRRTKTRKYDIEREEPLYIRRGRTERLREIAGRDPTPSQQIQAEDSFERALARLSELERKAVELRLSGLTLEQVASATGIEVRSLRRLLEAFRKKWEGTG